MEYLIKHSSCYQFQYCNKKVKISYVSSSMFDTDDVQTSSQIFDLILRSFILFFQDFNGSSSRRKDLQIVWMKSKKKWWKMSVVVTSFSNGDRACRTTQLKTVSTIDILINKVHKFQNSYFKKHPWTAATVLQKAYCLRGIV